MQFSRVITPVEDIQVWNATSDGFSFVISFASRSGPGFHGNPGFLASWRPIDQNRFACHRRANSTLITQSGRRKALPYTDCLD